MTGQWTTKKVAQRLEESVWVLNKLPDGRSSMYARYWPEIIYTQRELNRQPPKTLTVQPQPDAIDRMEESLSWIQWVSEEYRGLVWQRAYQIPLREIAEKMGVHHATVYRIWNRQLRAIADNLQP